MLRRVFFTLIAAVATASLAQASTIFYLTTDPNGGAVSNLDAKVVPGSTGTLYLAGTSDVQLSSVSLDVLSSNPSALKLTGASVVAGTPARYTFNDGPLTVAADGSSITSVGGLTVPNTGPTGVGTGSGVANPFVVASLSYTAGSVLNAVSNLSLRVGGNVIADWNGSAPSIQFGASATAIDGGNTGATGAAGVVTVIPEPATLSLLGLAMFGGLGASRRRR